jgi:hypothetical protein
VVEQLDERQLAELFRAAADDGPPASFGHSDVVAASRRATVRRRVAMAGGSALAVAVLLGGGLVGADLLRGGPEPDRFTSATGGSAQSDVNPHAESAPDAAEERADKSSPQATDQAPMELPGDQSQGTGTSGLVVPWPGLGDDDARAGCGRADRELADALAAELPAAAGTEAKPVPDHCPPDARAVAVPVMDGETPGWLYVVLAPVRGDGPTEQPVRRAEDGARGHLKYTPKGLVLMVLSGPAAPGGPAPFANETMRLAEELGSEY